MALKIEGFDWDQYNETKIAGKHGIERQVVEKALRGRIYVGPDLKHSDQEERYFAIASDTSGIWLFVVFTFRAREDGIYLRPITARRMHAKEIENYEKEIAQAEER